MTVHDSYYFQLDDLILADGRFMIEQVAGTNLIAARRGSPVEVGWRHGSQDTDEYHSERIQPLLITVHDTDTDGMVTHPAGGFGHLEANKNALFTVLGKRGRIDVRRWIPDPADFAESDESGGGPVQLQNYARVRRTVDLGGNSRTWQVFAELVFPYPFWHELPQVQRTGATSHTFDLGGSAPVADMVFTFAGAGTVSYGDVDIEVGEACVVDVGRREVFVSSVLDMGALVGTTDDNWMEWPAQSEITVTADVSVGIDYYTAWH